MLKPLVLVEDSGMNPTPTELLATVFFGAAVIHTFCVKCFAQWAHECPPGSARENLLHFLAEIEVVFGLWATALFFGITALKGSLQEAVAYIESLNFNEPKFVLVIMVVAATRPVVRLAETLISLAARLVPAREGVAFYVTALSAGPLMGSFITESAAMTLLALLLKRRYFDRGISRKLAYATMGLLFVNVSIGGTLTHFAAPPVLMVAAKWDWGIVFMFEHFGWRAAAACGVSTAIVTALFWKELNGLSVERVPSGAEIPDWLTVLHVAFLPVIVIFAHHPDVFFGVFVLFLGLVTVTREYQEPLKLREGLLVGFFLAGLVTLGSLQAYWLKPLIQSLSGNALFFGATGLTALTDNAALTYLGSLVHISDDLKYALVAGVVTGGGLTVIANAPNPAGIGILKNAKVFEDEAISLFGLFAGALLPTAVAVVFFWFIR